MTQFCTKRRRIYQFLMNSVRYISYANRARAFIDMEQYFAVDLQNGYGQLPVQPPRLDNLSLFLRPIGMLHRSVHTFWESEFLQFFFVRLANQFKAHDHFLKCVKWQYAHESYVNIFGAKNYLNGIQLKAELILAGSNKTRDAKFHVFSNHDIIS